MGSGHSKLNSSEEESVPIKVHTTLLGRFEEYRKQRNAESTLSKKQLLTEAEEEDGSTSNISQSSSHGTNATECHKVLDSTVVVPTENSECETTEETIDMKKDIDLRQENTDHSNEKVEAEIKTEEGNIEKIVEEVKEEKSGENDDNDSDNNDDESEEHGRIICPGSPSFRIYCIEADKRIAELQEKGDEEEGKSQTTILTHQKSCSADSVVSTAASSNIRTSNEERQIVVSESITKRKLNKVRKFGAVRTLLMVKSCYHPMSTCTGDDRRHLMAVKAAK